MDQNIIEEEENLKSGNFNGEMAPMQLDNEIYKYLGISLSEIPFIDEDNNDESTSNTRTNTCCQGSFINLPAATKDSSNFFNYQPLT